MRANVNTLKTCRQGCNVLLFILYDKVHLLLTFTFIFNIQYHIIK